MVLTKKSTFSPFAKKLRENPVLYEECKQKERERNKEERKCVTKIGKVQLKCQHERKGRREESGGGHSKTKEKETEI